MAEKKVIPIKVEPKVKKDKKVAKKIAKDAVEVTVSVLKETKKDEKVNGLTIDVLNTKGEKSGSIDLPQEIFGAKLNKILLSQAVRVYLANQRRGTSSTKTRGEVQGSTRKIYKQKGTGKARHGGIRAPIFVHGGIAFGPKPRDFSLDFPKRMRRAALFSALSQKLRDGEIKVVSGIEKIEPKTKIMVKILKALVNEEKSKSLMLVIPSAEQENVVKAARNIEKVTVISANQLNTYEVLRNKVVLFMDSSIKEAQNTFLKK